MEGKSGVPGFRIAAGQTVGEKKNQKAHLLAEQPQTESQQLSPLLSCHGAASSKPQLLTHIHKRIPTNTSLF